MAELLQYAYFSQLTRYMKRLAPISAFSKNNFKVTWPNVGVPLNSSMQRHLKNTFNSPSSPSAILRETQALFTDPLVSSTAQGALKCTHFALISPHNLVFSEEELVCCTMYVKQCDCLKHCL
jgi:hypothetical protein